MMAANVIDLSNFLAILLDASAKEPNTDLRMGLRAAAAGIQASIHVLCSGTVTKASLDELNGMWSYAERMLYLHNNPSDPISLEAQGNNPPRNAA